MILIVEPPVVAHSDNEILQGTLRDLSTSRRNHEQHALPPPEQVCCHSLDWVLFNCVLGSTAVTF